MIAGHTTRDQPPFPSSPSSRTVLAVQGSLRRAKPARPGPLRAVPNTHLREGKGGNCKGKTILSLPTVCRLPSGRPRPENPLSPLDDVNNLQA